MAILVPVALLMIVAVWLWINVRSESRQRVERMSGVMSDHVRRVLEANETVLEAALARLAGLSPEAIASDHSIHEFLVRLQSYSGSPTYIRVAHIATAQVVASSSGHPPVPVDLGEHDYFKAHRAGGPETFIGRVIRAPITGQLGFSISRRDPRSGLIAITVVPIEPLRAFFQGSAESTTDAVTFARVDGEPLTMFPGSVSLETYRLPATAVFMRYQRGELQGTETLPSGIDGRSRVWSISRVGPYPVQVLYGLDITAVRSLWFRRLLPFALISLLGSLVLLATGARLRRAETARLRAEADARWAIARANHADALAASEARSRLAIEATGLGTWDEDMRTRQTTWNEHAYRIFGFRPGCETMTSATWRERVHPDDWPHVAEAYRTALKDGALYRPEHRITRADGSVRWLNPYGNFLRNAKGEPYRFVGVFADITERKQADELIAEREARYRTLFTAIDEGFCLAEMIVDAQGKPVDYRFIEVNPLFETMTGMVGATGRTARDLIPELEQHWVDTYARVGLGRETLRFESSSEAMKRSFDVFAAPAEPRGCFVLVFKDVTDRKRAEEQKALLMRELSHRAKNLLSVIQSVARQTARHARDLADFEARFVGRVGALAVSIDRLVHQDWAGADLAALVRDQLRIFLDPESPRLVLEGPTVRLTPEATQNIGLALHELGTNAAKYGALTNASGVIHVTWSVSDGADGRRRFEMLWTESGGPRITELAKPGFGSTVITVLARMSLDAEVSLEFPPEGARWRFSCAADKALDNAS